jgi:hypothetical protein
LTRIVSASSTPAADYHDGALGPRRQSAVATGQLFEDEQGFVAPLTGNIAGFWCAVFHFGTSMEKLSDGTGPSRTLKIANLQKIIFAIRALGLPGRGKLQPWQSRQLDRSQAQPLNQPLISVVANAQTGTRWLAANRQICWKLTHRLNE